MVMVKRKFELLEMLFTTDKAKLKSESRLKKSNIEIELDNFFIATINLDRAFSELSRKTNVIDVVSKIKKS
jgi:hypothetical protein